MKLLFYLIFTILSIFSQTESFSQCCAAGNPSSTNCSLTDGGKNILNVSVTHFYSMSDSYYNGIKYESDKQFLPSVIQKSYFNFSSMALTYGLTNKIRLSADIGYFENKSQMFTNGYTRFAQGFADATLGITYNTYSSDDKLFDVLQTAKVTLPVGVFNQMYDDIQLQIDLQPSSGNYKYNLGFTLSKKFNGSNSI